MKLNNKLGLLFIKEAETLQKQQEINLYAQQTTGNRAALLKTFSFVSIDQRIR